jgi:hypothetical protein
MRLRVASSVPNLPALIAALAVVCGVLSMHAVDGGAHSSRAAGHGVSGSPSAAVSMHVEPARDALLDMPAELAGAAGHALLSPNAAFAGRLAPGIPEQGAAAVTAVCIAALLSFVVVVRRSVGRSWALPRGLSRWTRRAPSRRRPTPARPPDLLAELCVMRT